MSEPKHLKPLLEYILGIKIAEITYPEKQKTIDVNYGYKGVRLDVYCEDDEKTVYSVEISNMIDSHPEKDDWDIANTILYG